MLLYKCLPPVGFLVAAVNPDLRCVAVDAHPPASVYAEVPGVVRLHKQREHAPRGDADITRSHHLVQHPGAKSWDDGHVECVCLYVHTITRRKFAFFWV